MSLGNMGALALSSETAKYMFRRTACQCVWRTSCLFASHDFGPGLSFPLPAGGHQS